MTTATAPRFRPFPPLSCKYGAPLGRASCPLPIAEKPEQVAVAGPAGEYDAGGAYWGSGGTAGPVWAVWRKGAGRDTLAYVRARSKNHARRIACGLED
jgi:hypothetical protein